MKNSQTSKFLSFLLFLCFMAGITSCSDRSNHTYGTAASLRGKWQLLRIEDPYKVEVPPTDVVKLELNFKTLNQPGGNLLEEAGISGNMLSGKFTGRAVYKSSTSGGALNIGPLNVTEDVLFARYHHFDEHYLQELASATDYCILNDKLIIETKDGSELIYTRNGGN